MTEYPLTRLSQRPGAMSRLAGSFALALCKLHPILVVAPWNPRRGRC